jgi:hypothetical protein
MQGNKCKTGATRIAARWNNFQENKCVKTAVEIV